MPLGWAGIFGGLALGDRQFLQSEAVAFTWMGISALAIVLSITLLVPVFFEWLRKRRNRCGRFGGIVPATGGDTPGRERTPPPVQTTVQTTAQERQVQEARDRIQAQCNRERDDLDRGGRGR